MNFKRGCHKFSNCAVKHSNHRYSMSECTERHRFEAKILETFMGSREAQPCPRPTLGACSSFTVSTPAVFDLASPPASADRIRPINCIIVAVSGARASWQEWRTVLETISRRAVLCQLKRNTWRSRLSPLTPCTVTVYKLEGHSVERIYLRQRCSGDSVNKAILKPRLAVAARRGVKFRVAAHIRYRRKQSVSGIRTMIRIGLKS